MQLFINKKILMNSNSMKQYAIEILFNVLITHIRIDKDKPFLFVLKVTFVMITK